MPLERVVELHRRGPGLGRVAAAAEIDVDLRIEAGEEQERLFPGDEQRGIEVGPARVSCKTVASPQVRP